MKISELVTLLNEIKNSNEDLEVCFIDQVYNEETKDFNDICFIFSESQFEVVSVDFNNISTPFGNKKVLTII